MISRSSAVSRSSLNGFSFLRGQPEQPQLIGDGALRLAQLCRRILLRHAVIRNELFDGARLVEKGQILPLDILHQRQHRAGGKPDILKAEPNVDQHADRGDGHSQNRVRPPPVHSPPPHAGR